MASHARLETIVSWVSAATTSVVDWAEANPGRKNRPNARRIFFMTIQLETIEKRTVAF